MSQTSTTNTAVPTALEPPLNGLYVGEIRLFPFRHNKLPFGWYFCNGERFEFASPQGQVLTGLDEDFRADWNMETDVCSIGLPNLFHEDGRGCFLRPVDGVKRRVGAEEGDAIRNITGRLLANSYGSLPDFIADGDGYAEGCLKLRSRYSAINNAAGKSGASQEYAFDASLVVPTAPENRPLNLGMTPAIYLGV